MSAGGTVSLIPGVFHNDIYLAEQAMAKISSRIREWFSGEDTEKSGRS